MKAPRGLKKILKTSQSVKLVGSGRFRGFQLLKAGKPTNVKLSGLTKKLDSKIFSSGSSFPSHAIRGSEKKIGWRGKSGGRRRGSAVDAQLSKCVNSGKLTPQKGFYSLTKLILIALSESGLVPVLAQRGCSSVSSRVATASDLICYNSKTSKLTIVELKCGFSGSRTTASQIHGKPCHMNAPVESAPDCFLNRHMAQLAATIQLTQSETKMLEKVASLGVDTSSLEGILLYANEDACDLIPIPEWWMKRAPRLVRALA